MRTPATHSSGEEAVLQREDPGARLSATQPPLPDRPPGHPQPLKGLRRGHLVDVVPVDVENRVLSRLLVLSVDASLTLPSKIIAVPLVISSGVILC